MGCIDDNSCLSTSQIVIPDGPTGTGISGIAWTSNSGGSPVGTQGTTDTYTVTYTDASTDTFVVTNGADGIVGEFGGYSGEWVFSTSGTAAATELDFNGAVGAAVTTISVNDLNKDNTDYSAFLDSFDNTIDTVDYYGLVRIWKRSDSDTFWYGEITATTPVGTTVDYTVTYIQHNGTFLAADDVVMSFTPRGANGTADKEVLYTDLTSTSTTSATPTQLKAWTIPADTLVDIGDTLEATFHATRTGANKFSNLGIVHIGGTAVTSGSVDWVIGNSMVGLVVNIVITRASTTQVFLEVSAYLEDFLHTEVPTLCNNALFPFVSANTNVIEFIGSSISVGNTIAVDKVLIKKFDI